MTETKGKYYFFAIKSTGENIQNINIHNIDILNDILNNRLLDFDIITGLSLEIESKVVLHKAALATAHG